MWDKSVMRIIVATNVNIAYEMGLSMLLKDGIEESSRAGDVIAMPYPITTCYILPTERVLFDPVRDANPFFHLFEALWMLAGRNDATWLDQFVSDFSKRYAENNGVMHGAYGYRWRNHWTRNFDVQNVVTGETIGQADPPIDQLHMVIEALKSNPRDRRVVIQMWDPDTDLGQDKLDIPCNLCVLPRITHDTREDPEAQPQLDITVMCRSNDAVWGAHGANAVHFSVLQEYLAAMIGVKVGHYYQHSNNYHVYTNILGKVKVGGPRFDPYHGQNFGPKLAVRKLVDNTMTFDRELRYFLDHPQHHRVVQDNYDAHEYSNGFFTYVAAPMYRAHQAYKRKHWNHAFEQLALMPPNNDWYKAAYEWMMRRREKDPDYKPRFSEGRPGGLLG